MTKHLKSLAVGFVGTVLAAIVLGLGYTAYTDHYLVRALVGIEQQRQAAQIPYGKP